MAKKKAKNYKFANEVCGVVLIGLGVLLGLCAYSAGSDAPILAVLRSVTFGLFGIMGYVAPPALLAGGILLIIGRHKRHKPVKIVFGIVGFFTLMAFIHTCYSGRFNLSLGYIGYIVSAYEIQTVIGGGVFGALLAYPLNVAMGAVGAGILLMTLFLVSFIIVTGISIKNCFVIIRNWIANATDQSGFTMDPEEPREKNKGTIAQRMSAGGNRRKAERAHRAVLKEAFDYDEMERRKNETYLEEEGYYEKEEPRRDFVSGEELRIDEPPFDEDDRYETELEVPSAVPRERFVGRSGFSGDELLIVRPEDVHSGTAEQGGVKREEKRKAEESGMIPEGISPVEGYKEPEEKESPLTQTGGKTPAVYPGLSSVKKYQKPPITLLKQSSKKTSGNASVRIREHAAQLEETLNSFNIPAKVVNASVGPSVVRFEIQPAPGVNVNKIVNLQKNLAMALAADSIRIEAPIPGKSAVGIEVSRPVEDREMVVARDLIASDEFKKQKSILAFALGKDIAGKKVFADLAKMPHLLISGTTGSGKSVCTNMILTSMLYRATPEDIQFIIIDPKIVEFEVYNGIPHLKLPVVTDPKKAANALNWGVGEMLRRYKTFAGKGVKEIERYNALMKTEGGEKMPKLVILIDELADLMLACRNDVENAICRIAQLGRAAGVHLIVATQRPSVDVVTGLIKSNMPSRIALKASSQIDSRTMIDKAGAEKLMGNGDMLFFPAGANMPVRVQGCYLDEEETQNIVEFLSNQGVANYDESIVEENTPGTDKEGGSVDGELDETLKNAIRLSMEYDMMSTSMLQRRLKLGYPRAARIMDQLEDMGVVGAQEGSKGRPVILTREQFDEIMGEGSDDLSL